MVTTRENTGLITATTMAEVREQLRRTPLFRQVVPLEARFGWPIPIRTGKTPDTTNVYVMFPLYSMGRTTNGLKQLFPPFAAITLDWTTKRPVEYVDLRFRRSWPESMDGGPVGSFPHPALTDVATSVAAYERMDQELLGMYDELLAMLAEHQPLPRAWMDRFGKLLRIMVEPGLEPYYRALGPKFFDRFLDPTEAAA